MRFSARVTLWKRPTLGSALAVCLLLATDALWVFARFPQSARARIYSVSALPVARTPVLILGAGVLPDREPTHVLQSRLDTGLELFRAGKGSWFLVSGDNREHSYNEPQAMRRWLLRGGVPDELVISDYAGRRTYDSLRRAQVLFGVRQVIIVTSDFHLPRALFLARHLGLDAYGVPASTGGIARGKRLGMWGREFVARNVATWDAWFPPSTLLGHREPTPDNPNP
jgi:vancomycin permeability regulator SanA